jgi:hypothetical protein
VPPCEPPSQAPHPHAPNTSTSTHGQHATADGAKKHAEPTRRPPIPDSLAQLITKLDNTIDRARKTRADLPHLYRRAQHLASDPYPDSVRPSEAPPGSPEDSPVERAALTERSPNDPVLRLLLELFDDIDQADTTTKHMEVGRQIIHRSKDRYLRRPNAADECIVTRPRDGNESTHNVPLAKRHYVTGAGDDRLKANYCPACYTAWQRARKAEPAISPTQFEVRRLAEILADQAAAS